MIIPRILFYSGLINMAFAAEPSESLLTAGFLLCLAGFIEFVAQVISTLDIT